MSSPVTAGQKLFGTYSLWKNETSKLVAAKKKTLRSAFRHFVKNMIWIELVQMATLEDKWLAIRCASFVMGNNPTPCNRQELANEQRPAAELQQPSYSSLNTLECVEIVIWSQDVSRN